MDVNPCSATYLNTRAGTLIESNSTGCGYIPPTATPTPTPLPENVLYDVYQSCPNPFNYYYVNYSSGNQFQATVNGVCCQKVDTNVNLEYINATYGSAIGPTTASSGTCDCE
jgi:hypothetical protein